MPHTDPEKKRAYERAYKQRPEVKGRNRAYAQARRDRDPELRAYDRAYALAWRASNIEHAREACRKSAAAWAAKNPDARRVQHSETMSRRRARLLGCGSEKYSRELAMADGVCSYCGGSANQLDHVQPLALSGTDTLDNVVPCCKRCNSSKSDTPLLLWFLRKAG